MNQAADRLFDFKLLFLERREHRHIGQGAGNFVCDATVDPGMFGLKGGDMRVVHATWLLISTSRIEPLFQLKVSHYLIDFR